MQIGWATRGEKNGIRRAWVAQLVERVLGKDEVTGSNPVPGSSLPEEDRHAAGKIAGVTQR
jgi:hypothetical protein